MKSIKPADKVRDVILVLGKTGYGKSVWTKTLLKPLKRVFLYDLARDYDGFKYLSGDSLSDCCRLVDEEMLPNEFRIAVWKDYDVEAVGSMAFMEGDNHLVLEEMSTIHSRGQVIDNWFKEAIYLGRHRRLSLVCTAQRAPSIPIELRSQANRVVSFQQAEMRDMDWLKEYFGENTEQIYTLPKLCCLDFHNGDVSRYSISIPDRS